MDAKMKNEIRRRLNTSLSELHQEMVNQGGVGFEFSISDYAGGLTIKLKENEAPQGFGLGSAASGSATLAPADTDDSDDGDE